MTIRYFLFASMVQGLCTLALLHGGEEICIDTVQHLLHGTGATQIEEVKCGRVVVEDGIEYVYLDLDAMDFLSYNSFDNLLSGKWDIKKKFAELDFYVVTDPDGTISCFERECFDKHWRGCKKRDRYINPLTGNSISHKNFKGYTLQKYDGRIYAHHALFVLAVRYGKTAAAVRCYINRGCRTRQNFLMWDFVGSYRDRYRGEYCWQSTVPYAAKRYVPNDFLEELLMAKDADIDEFLGNSLLFGPNYPLAWAVSENTGNDSFVQYLLNKEVSHTPHAISRRIISFNSRRGYGASPFKQALCLRRFEVAQKMLECPYIVKHQFSSKYYSALYHLVGALPLELRDGPNGNAEAVEKIRELIDFLLSTQQGSDDYMRNVLCYAAEHGPLWFMESLLKKNIFEVNQRDDAGEAPLECAVKREHVDLIKLLLEAGADPNTVCGKSTALGLILRRRAGDKDEKLGELEKVLREYGAHE